MPKRPTKPPHYGTVQNRETFAAAYASILAAPKTVYQTAAGTPFTAHAVTAIRGKHPGAQVIVFKQDGIEMARAYDCCWGHKTNCNRTYIDSYSPVI